MKNICKVCNAEFESKRKKEYCSERCYSKYKYYNKKKYLLKCNNCGKEFNSYKNDLRFCSKKCATSFTRNKNKNKVTISMITECVKNNQVTTKEIERKFNISTRKIYNILNENGFSSYKEFLGTVNGVYLEKNRSDTSISALKYFDCIKDILNCEYELEKKFDGLINPRTNKKLRIDCYFEKYNIAVEYNGIQHYNYIPFFHDDNNTLEYQQHKDKIKIDFCKNNNIKLLIIKYNENLSINNLKNILAELISSQASESRKSN